MVKLYLYRLCQTIIIESCTTVYNVCNILNKNMFKEGCAQEHRSTVLCHCFQTFLYIVIWPLTACAPKGGKVF